MQARSAEWTYQHLVSLLWQQKVCSFHFPFYKDNADRIKALDPDALEHMIYVSCNIKREVVENDPKEKGERALLNFGHTLGHAIERETKYTQYNHGEAVAIGMVGAAVISRELGLINQDIVKRICQVLHKCRLPQKCSNCSEDGIYNDLFHDKKTIGGKINWVLLDKIGRVHVDNNVSENIVRRAIKYILE